MNPALLSRTKSHQAIFSSARKLFFSHGVRKVTVEDICSHAEVSKMTFYRVYKNKLEVAKDILTIQAEEGLALYEEVMHGSMSFPEKVAAVIQMKHDRSKEFSKVFLADLMQHQPELLESMMGFRLRMLEMFREDLLQAQKEGYIRDDLSVDFIMYMVDKFNQKLIDEEFLALFSSAEEAVTALTRYFFYGVLSDKGHE